MNCEWITPMYICIYFSFDVLIELRLLLLLICSDKLEILLNRGSYSIRRRSNSPLSCFGQCVFCQLVMMVYIKTFETRILNFLVEAR